MAVPTTLSTWLFADDLGAQRSARRLAAASLTCPALDDAAIVSWPADRSRPTAWQARDVAVDRPLAGAFWGLLFAQLFLLPLSLQAPPPLTDQPSNDTLGWLGVDAGFVDTVRRAVAPGRSAVFLVTASPLDPALGDHLVDGVDIAELQLSSEQTSRLHAGFGDD
jgi:uncharacterized membrane protein